MAFIVPPSRLLPFCLRPVTEYLRPICIYVCTFLSSTGTRTAGQDVFQTPLFSSGNLSSGPHEITITNRVANGNGASDFFDIDFATWEGSLPDGSTSKTFTSRDTQFEHLPGPNWWSWGDDSKSYDGILDYAQSSSAAFRTSGSTSPANIAL